MSIIFNKRFSSSIFLSIIILFVSTLDSNGQIKPPGLGQPKNAFQFKKSVTDSSNNGVIFARLPEKRLSDNPLQKTSRIMAACNTSTFYMHLSGSTGQKINLKGLQTLPDGNFIITGNISSSGFAPEGMLCIMSNSGLLVSQRQLKINNNPVTLFTTIVLLGGKLVIAGTLNDGSNKAFISLLNADLSTNWVHVFNLPSMPSKVTISLTEINQFTFAVQLSGSILYSLLNMDGTVVWNKEAFPAGLDELIGFNESVYNEYVLLTNCTRMGKKVVDILSIKPDGTINSSQIAGNGNDENKYGNIKSFNGRLLTLGVAKNEMSQFQLTRNIIAFANKIETEHTYTIPLNIDFNTSSAFDNAGDVMGFCFPQQGKLVFVRHFAYYQTAPEHTRQYDVPTGSSIVAVARSFTDGGYILGLNTNNSDELILIKTDSIGALPGCGYKTISNDYTETLNKQNTPATTTGGDISILSTSGTLSNETVMLNTKFDCKQNYCPAPPVDDTCLSSYFKIYRTNSYAEGFGSYNLMRNNNIIVSFAKYNRILGNSNVLTYGIKLLNEKGHFIKGVNVYCDGITTSLDLRKIDDRHVMAILYSVKNGRPCYTFTLIDDDLQIVWSKSYETFQNYNFHGIDLTTDTEGNFYFVGNNLGFNEDASVLAFKIDPAGNQVWLKIYGIQDGLFLQSSATTTNTSLIVVIEGGTKGSVSVRFDKATGEMLNAYRYANSSGGLIYHRLLQFDKDRIFYAGNDKEGRFLMGLFDTTGKPVKSKYISDLSTIPRAATVKSGSLYAIYASYSGMQDHEVLMKVDTSLSIQFSNKFDRLGYPAGIQVSDIGSIYVGGNYVYGGGNGNYYNTYIQKYDSSGVPGTCSYQSVTPELIDADVTFTSPSFYPVSRSFAPIDIPVVFIPSASNQNISEIKCSSTPLCTSVKVTGPGTVCSLNDSFTYEAKRNPGCNLEPYWIYDTAFAVLQSSTTSSADFKFKKAGNSWIKASINAGCSLFVDSILVQVQNSPLSFTLGNDRVICQGDSIKLNAGTGFHSYQWQDGSADSTFIVSAPGIYYVGVDNLCGNFYTDSILISSATIPKLYIGKDTSVCIGDTLNIKASSGFNIYTWQSSDLIPWQGNTISIIAGQNEQISVIATTSDGCNAYDTLHITDLYAQPVFLGNDTSFCLSDSITLSAASGYAHYTWSNGASTPSVNLKSAGLFWVKVKDINGCTAKDTLIVKQLFALPDLHLGDDFDLCNGDERKLDAGNFNQYLWNDGSLERYKIVKTPGLYWVKVSDINNCSAIDSVLLENILPVPANFLKQVDSICKYDKLSITPLKNYSNYMWSTGFAQRTLIVQETGKYILTVTDANNCMGKDTILITEKRDCTSGIFIPNAFTPNGDHLNDLFNARILGNIISFQLKVYNQWGELIFSTNNVQGGWDGKLKGEPSNAGVFVWLCTYQFQGSKPAFQKGIVTLVR